MSITPADLSTLSRLLDEAIELEPMRVDGWLDSLPPSQAHLRPMLRGMLAEYQATGRAAFMASGPQLDDDAASDESVERAGECVGPYRLLHEIGRGGMGTVWLAERADGSFQRRVAIKLPRLAWGASLAERMQRERDIGALLEHPNIARLYDAGLDAAGRPYLALEYIDGQPLDAWCTSQALPLRARLQLFVQVAKAVAYAHGRLVVHRDLKPSNVLVTPDGRAHLLDFGIAKRLESVASDEPSLTQEQGRLLTPSFASPEQILGQPITVASDVYSLGVLLYQLLTGQLPHAPARKSLAAMEEAILAGEPPLASSKVADRAWARQLRGDIDAILTQALKVEPGQRYATADAFAADVERHLAGDCVLAKPDSPVYRLRKALQRHRVGFAAGAAVLVAVLTGAGAALAQAHRANDSAERARVVKEFVVEVFRVNERGTVANAELRQLPAEMLLERGARLIDAKFPGQPKLQAELYGVVGGIFVDMGANASAADYAKRQVDTLATVDTTPSERAAAAMLLAEALSAQGQLAEAHRRAADALALAEGDAALHPKALVLLARVMRKQGQNDAAMAKLDRAERDFAGRAGPSVAAAQAKSVRAAIISDLNRFDEAVPIYRSAIDEALAAEGPLSATAIDVRLALAQGLLLRDRLVESRPVREAALAAMRASGGPGDVRAAREESTTYETLFLMDQASFEEARTVIERSRAALAARGPLVPESIRAAVDFDLGTIYLDWGAIAEAKPLITATAPVLRRASESPSERFLVAGFEGAMAMYEGRHDDADRVLRERLALRQQGGQKTNPFAAYDYAFVAMNKVMQGRFDDAEAVLASSPPFDDMKGKGGAATKYTEIIRRTLARSRLERGDAAGALALLPTGDESADVKFPFDDLMLRGEILCANAKRSEGLPLIATALKYHAEKDAPQHPDLARARAIAGLCALAAGQRAQAVEMAALARTSFDTQPQVSPYFKAPLAKLELALR